VFDEVEKTWPVEARGRETSGSALIAGKEKLEAVTDCALLSLERSKALRLFSVASAVRGERPERTTMTPSLADPTASGEIPLELAERGDGQPGFEDKSRFISSSESNSSSSLTGGDESLTWSTRLSARR
jgi:hypothetical protein